MENTVFGGLLTVCAPRIRDGKGVERDPAAWNIAVAETREVKADDLILVRRTFTNEGTEPRTLQLIFDVAANYAPTRFTIPAIVYNGNKRSDGKEPHGWEKDGALWYQSCDRTAVPACTLFENADRATAIFCSDEKKDNLFCSVAAVFAENDKRHRILWPDCNMPEAYTDHDIMTEKEERFLTLGVGESFETAVYLWTGKPRWENYAMATFIDRLVDIFPFRHEAHMDVATAKKAAYADFEAVKKVHDDGTVMYDNALRDRPDGDYQYAPWKVNECGWSGQNMSIARHQITLWTRGEDPTGEHLRDGLSSMDAWAKNQRGNGLLQINYYRELSKDYVPADTCNLGWAAHEMLMCWDLLRDTEYARPQYRAYAEKLLDFLCAHYTEDDAFGMRWDMDGNKVTSGGSAGGFVIMALCLAARLLGRKDYLDVAERAIRFYFKRDLDDFVVTAGALDCACIDKEGAYPFIVSALDLYELTGESDYLTMAKKAAYYFTSWMFFYDVVYREHVNFDDVGYYTAGGTGVSTQHPVIDPWGVILPPELLRLEKYTGSTVWRDIAYRMWCNAILCVNLDENKLWLGHHRRWGMQSEAFFQSSWSRASYHFNKAACEKGRLNDLYANWTSSFRLMTIEKVEKLEGNLDFFERK